jgi:hypothetical protein
MPPDQEALERIPESLLESTASDFNMRAGHPSAIRKASPFCAKLIESYCAHCGLLIAASPRRRVLSVMEKIHACPVYFFYPQPLKRAG